MRESLSHSERSLSHRECLSLLVVWRSISHQIVLRRELSVAESRLSQYLSQNRVSQIVICAESQL